MTESLTRIETLTEEEWRRGYPDGEDDGSFGVLVTERGALPLVAMDVRARVEGLLALTTVRQTFVNSIDEPIEATYVFPLPGRDAVRSFRMEIGDRVIEGEIKERGEARREYDDALHAGHRAAITEEERPGVFTVRVGNLMPGDRATVELTLAGPLAFDDGEATYRFPLVVAPRYIPGIPLPGESVGDGVAPDTDAVPDASRITPPVLLPGYPNPVRLSIAVELSPGGLDVTRVRSSLHTVVESEDETGARILRVSPGERLDRDFVLRFAVGGSTVAGSLVVRPDEEGDEGTFALTIVPPVSAATTARPRDVVVVLDRSGSMMGWKIVAARRAASLIVDTLTEGDRFAVLAFDHEVEAPPSLGEGLVPATDRHRFRAVEFLAGLDDRGGTEMAEPLERAARELAAAGGGRDRVLVLVTDGQVGDEDQILRRLARPLAGVRVFALGIDQAVNEAFLARLADLGDGATELVESEDRLDDVMEKIHRRIGNPVLTGVSLGAEGMEILPDTVVPSRPPDLFAGAPLVVTGRWRGTPGPITVRGRTATGEPFAETVSPRESGNDAIAAVWARGLVRELEDRYVTGRGDPEELERRIVTTSVKFRVLCRFTAFVAVDYAEKANVGGDVHRVIQPVELPSGWDLGVSEVMACSSPMEAGAGFASPVRARRKQKIDAAPPSWRRRLKDLLRDHGEDEAQALADEIERVMEDLEAAGEPAELIDRLRDAVAALREPGGAGWDRAMEILMEVTRGRRGGKFWR